MKDFKILHVKNKKFSIEELERLLAKELPGNYKLFWYTNSDKWEMNLKYDGVNFIDLYTPS